LGDGRLRVRNSPPISQFGKDYAMPFLRTAKKDEIPPGTIREFDIDGKNIALANVEGKLFAINNVCLHRGGPLGEGELEGQVVVCPWHGWKYDVTTGKLTTNPTVGVQCYAVEIRGDDIYVDLG
jgi:nitrite reductase (NADH) small subunit